MCTFKFRSNIKIIKGRSNELYLWSRCLIYWLPAKCQEVMFDLHWFWKVPNWKIFYIYSIRFPTCQLHKASLPSAATLYCIIFLHMIGHYFHFSHERNHLPLLLPLAKFPLITLAVRRTISSPLHLFIALSWIEFPLERMVFFPIHLCF